MSTSQQYFFVLGATPALSAAEIFALLGKKQYSIIEVSKQILIIEIPTNEDFNPITFMSSLGGTIKIGAIQTSILPRKAEELTSFMVDHLSLKAKATARTTFGFSMYSLDIAGSGAMITEFKNVGMEVKGRLKEAGIGSRWVKAQTGTDLTSVVVKKDHLIEEGDEFVVLVKGETILIGTTSVVQPFETFADIDYGRPSRDMEQGMLPPKLARIMINLANLSTEPKDKTLLDPFCGSGTVLTEALQLGFTALLGSDKNAVAVESTKKNIDWLKNKKSELDTSAIKLFTADARDVGQHTEKHSLDAIVSELYLGPSRTGQEKRGDLQKMLAELSNLYYEAMSSWKSLLKPDGCVVLALPVYIIGNERHGIQASIFSKLGFDAKSPLQQTVLSRLDMNETKNHGLFYGRGDQLVWREIVTFTVRPLDTDL